MSIKMLNIVSMITDKTIIKRYILRCKRRGMTLNAMAAEMGKTGGWASLLVNEKINGLKWSTRNRMIEILGRDAR
jgi:hypothetical protein